MGYLRHTRTYFTSDTEKPVQLWTQSHVVETLLCFPCEQRPKLIFFNAQQQKTPPKEETKMKRICSRGMGDLIAPRNGINKFVFKEHQNFSRLLWRVPLHTSLIKGPPVRMYASQVDRTFTVHSCNTAHTQNCTHFKPCAVGT